MLLLPDLAPADIAALQAAEVPDPALALAQLEHQIELKAAGVRDHLRDTPVVGQTEPAPRPVQDEPEEAGGSVSGSGASGSASEPHSDSDAQ
ncbi:hypothetical protein MNEG_10623 [Monoraphidium neglectum]|uniref:Uncharacterized protein n=1 Tax=Monoraphidium neglectum TaxID=145388 RepID=A0A0D2MRZ5_9CHLO|nr:hypothetical protein MNEG_10623 [Monoraphidium neglectum]KIY97340.1 hypothetical protein MNEG_10623 [Monoraphidium neglectum]|eukprot:XP_013896360.1 hypothetical protein MNEG_10623 [Monoraphidium neglectum]